MTSLSHWRLTYLSVASTPETQAKAKRRWPRSRRRTLGRTGLHRAPALPGAPGSASPETRNSSSPSLRESLKQLHLGPGRGALTALPSPPSLLDRRASSRHPAQPRAAPPPTSIPDPHQPSAPSPRVTVNSQPWRQNNHQHPHERVLLPGGGVPGGSAAVRGARPGAGTAPEPPPGHS